MKRWTITIAVFAGACAGQPAAETTDPTTPLAASATPPASPGTPAANAARGGTSNADAASVAAQTIPAGARYTIFCETFAGPDHVTRSTEMKNLMMRNSRARGWYVLHQQGQSSLYHGYYKEFNVNAPGSDSASKNDAQRAQGDKAIVDAIPNPRAVERKLFPRSMFVPLDAPDPDAPPEWNLSRTPASAFWSVQVAAFTGAERKQNAVEAVREARAMNIDAYYYHGDAVSSVCVGTWPAEAIKRQDAARAESQRDGNETLVVNLGETELTPEQRRQYQVDGRPVRVLQAKVEILNPTLKKTLEQYPEHAIDGAVEMVRLKDARTGADVMRPKSAFVVRIIRQASGAGFDGAAANDPAVPPMPTGGGTRDLGTRLRGLGQ